ncbi:PDZ domain-containing protein [Secundilactobacillus folii]|uniref:Serine protease n=1 Tax=Secundilactobacillus folii TaxID=2678357 RepID=A0A7X2XWK6_9LACO|nr:PDZ domain-containing protein [Secundilactobacillus folii]MTV82420.1 serine protease [Secundilactobacillus folii]
MGLLILTLVVQPVWWIALIREWRTADRRIVRERRAFESAVYTDKFEVRHFILLSLLFGLGLSVVSLLAGLTVPVGWYLCYSAGALIAVVIIPVAGLPMTIFIGSVVLYVWVKQMGWASKLTRPVTQRFGLTNESVNMANLVILLAALLIVLGFWLHRTGGRFASPRIFAQQRGKLIAGYPFNELLVIPTLVLVPGNWLTSHLAFWPVLSVGGMSFTPLFLPLLIGLKMTVFKQNPRTALTRLATMILRLGIVVLIAGIVSLFFKMAVLPILGLAYVCYLGCLIHARLKDHHQSFWFSKVDHGVRVLGIKPETPAAKMDVQVGDIMVQCNGQSIYSEKSFYEALMLDPTYCHLKIRTPKGDLKVTETAIFDGAPHEIGIVVFKD